MIKSAFLQKVSQKMKEGKTPEVIFEELHKEYAAKDTNICRAYIDTTMNLVNLGLDKGITDEKELVGEEDESA